MKNPTPDSLRIEARRARVRGVRAALFTAVVLAGVGYGIWGTAAAEGVLLGGIAGALGFWSMSMRLEHIATVRPDRLHVSATLWTFYRLAIYAAFMFAAYRLDMQSMRGLLGGIAGLLSTRFAVIFIAVRESRPAGQSSSKQN